VCVSWGKVKGYQSYQKVRRGIRRNETSAAGAI
jgi:hypothetical protein